MPKRFYLQWLRCEDDPDFVSLRPSILVCFLSRLLGRGILSCRSVKFFVVLLAKHLRSAAFASRPIDRRISFVRERHPDYGGVAAMRTLLHRVTFSFFSPLYHKAVAV